MKIPARSVTNQCNGTCSVLVTERGLSVLVCRMTKTHEDEMERRQREAEDRLAAMQRAADRKLKETLAQFESTQMDEMDKMDVKEG